MSCIGFIAPLPGVFHSHIGLQAVDGLNWSPKSRLQMDA